MRNKGTITKEIVELSEIRSAYNHYLGSHRGLTEVENTTQIQKNKTTVVLALRNLYVELARLNKEIDLFGKIRTKKIQHSELEKNAIMHFNRDDRFTITE